MVFTNSIWIWFHGILQLQISCSSPFVRGFLVCLFFFLYQEINASNEELTSQDLYLKPFFSLFFLLSPSTQTSENSSFCPCMHISNGCIRAFLEIFSPKEYANPYKTSQFTWQHITHQSPKQNTLPKHPMTVYPWLESASTHCNHSVTISAKPASFHMRNRKHD